MKIRILGHEATSELDNVVFRERETMIKGLGVDTVELSRIKRVYEEYGERFLNRVFADDEQAYSLRFKDPVPRLAARFAAKEACMKALGTGWGNGIRWRDIVVSNSPSGRPELSLRGTAKHLATHLDVSRIHLSITHGRECAVVVVIFE